ncbi:unnamed protein product [Coffea canephora]|uniref:RING-CH-type domain-containing protein n=2 Tax=Coffea TaxID=13442 RepID=A0A068TNA1_COFCA|nr:uncharacterized protein LOC113726189 [Coffea arabica]CDO96838.1 unnamed protein product [Coffea canephora]
MEKSKTSSENSISSTSTCQNSRVSVDQETRITIREDESSESGGEKSGDCGEKSEGLTVNKGLNNDLGLEEDKYSCGIEVKRGNIDGENQRLCRICHLSKPEDEKNSMDLIELGCGCRGELGFAHSHCAEAWFKLRGNRLCEICGETAKNVTGVSDNRFLEEWNEQGITNGAAFSSGRRRGCLHSQPLCNFLMACLVIAFVLPWFFRVNMF